jgi:hypothetical protein
MRIKIRASSNPRQQTVPRNANALLHTSPTNCVHRAASQRFVTVSAAGTPAFNAASYDAERQRLDEQVRASYITSPML